MKFKSAKEIEKHFNDFKYDIEVHEAIEFLLNKINDVRNGEFVGRIISDFYCNGFFGSRYDLSGSEIIASGSNYITIRNTEGEEETAEFEEGWQLREMSSLIDDWTK